MYSNLYITREVVTRKARKHDGSECTVPPWVWTIHAVGNVGLHFLLCMNVVRCLALRSTWGSYFRYSNFEVAAIMWGQPLLDQSILHRIGSRPLAITLFDRWQKIWWRAPQSLLVVTIQLPMVTILELWEEVEPLAIVTSFRGNRFKSFQTRHEAEIFLVRESGRPHWGVTHYMSRND